MSDTLKPLVPRLRFPEFRDSGEWVKKRLGELANRVTERVGAKTLTPVSITAGIGFVSQVEKFGRDISGRQYENYVVLRRGQYSYNKGNSKSFPQGAIHQLLQFEEAAVPNAFYSFEFKRDYVPEFYSGYFETNFHGRQLVKFITSGARSDGLLNVSARDFFSIVLPTPTDRIEQQKIAECLTSLDDVIELEAKRLDALKCHKKGLLQQLFPREGETTPRLRFPEFRDAGEWEVKKLGEVLDYERPEKYIVESDNYGSNGIPVLTANKSFLLGYTSDRHGVYEDTPAIIFDDFTTDKKFVDFPFKIKSSAIKILKPKGKNNLRFIFELMNLIKFDPKQHKRYYISEYQNIAVHCPTLPEQQKIADCLSALDELIELEAKRLDALKRHKKGLLQQLFPQEI